MATRPEVILVRHGETEWSRAGRHTSSTDLPLTDSGERQARELCSALAGLAFALVLSSPLIRARRTAELAGFDEPELDDDLRELDYGDYEGRTTADIQGEVPGWTVWTGVLPGGESLADAAARADRVIERIRVVDGSVLVFGHGHLSRILAARWCGLPPAVGAHLVLGTASVSSLGYERAAPALRFWNVAIEQLVGSD
ncbi:MAG: histidine phosphatase family protein [Actinomycetes bacterium]|jgi:probable phosphoglycerate mutase|nr:histidine phosphatase family protein [Actinomycetes bacterium]